MHTVVGALLINAAEASSVFFTWCALAAATPMDEPPGAPRAAPSPAEGSARGAV